MISDSLDCSGHNIVEFLLSTLEVITKTKVLGVRRTNFSSLRAQLGGILWKVYIDDKGDNECLEFFRNTLLEAQRNS